MACINFMKLGLSRTEVEHLINEWVLNERDRKAMYPKEYEAIIDRINALSKP